MAKVLDRVTDITSGTPTEPMTTAEAKTHCRVPSGTSADDTYIAELIKAARGAAEDYTQATLVIKRFMLALDAWPGCADEWWDGTREGPMDMLYSKRREILMPRPPLYAINSVTVYDDSDTGVAFTAAGNFYVDISDPRAKGRIVLRRGAVWPPALRVANAIMIDYAAGYGNTGMALPTAIKQGIKMTVMFMYRNRGEATEEAARNALHTCGGNLLLDQHVVKRL